MKKFAIITIITMIGLFGFGCGRNMETTQSIDSDISIEQELADKFNLDFASGYGKELEDAWKADPSNEQLSAMYHYYNAKFYAALDEKDMAKNEMSNIRPGYSGIMATEISDYGIELYESSEVWDGDNKVKENHVKTISESKRIEIKSWITNRYDYYDGIEGTYAGDKYTDTIFNEAGLGFGYTYQEIYNIWSDLPL